MHEFFRCPGCAVPYGLHKERVSAEIRRARCVRCGHIFGIEEAVTRLLGLEPAPETHPESSEALPGSGTTVELAVMDFPEIDFASMPEAPVAEASEPVPAWTDAQAEDLTAGSLEALLTQELAPEAAPEPEAPLPVEAEANVLPDQVQAEAISLPDEFPAFDASLLDGLPEPTPLPEPEQPDLEVPALETPVVAEAGVPTPEETTPVTEQPVIMDQALETLETLSAFAIPAAAFEPAEITPVYHAEPSPTDTLQSLPPMEDRAPTLSMMDLDSDDDILDRTIITHVPPPAPEAPVAEGEQEPHAEHGEGEGFHSAKDAISKLLGGLNAPAKEASRSTAARPLDMDAAMNALDGTLGTSQAPSAGTATTQRLTMEDLQAALKGMPRNGQPAGPAVAPSSLPPAAPAYSTVAAFPGPDASSQDPYLLKIRVGNDLYENLSVERLSEWILQGRVLESFPVARQHSENWIEAVRVPALRPVFEKARRTLGEPALPPPPPEPGSSQKRGLFGGLFGRG